MSGAKDKENRFLLTVKDVMVYLWECPPALENNNAKQKR